MHPSQKPLLEGADIEGLSEYVTRDIIGSAVGKLCSEMTEYIKKDKLPGIHQTIIETLEGKLLENKEELAFLARKHVLTAIHKYSFRLGEILLGNIRDFEEVYQIVDLYSHQLDLLKAYNLKDYKPQLEAFKWMQEKLAVKRAELHSIRKE